MAPIVESVGFTEEDGHRVVSLAEPLGSYLPQVVNAFYEALIADPVARAVFTGGEQQLARQRVLLGGWLGQLFEGSYGEGYIEKRFRIGVTHVQVGLPQHYMCVGVEYIWRMLDRHARQLDIDDLDEKLRSLHKLLMLDLAIMMESYKESYSAQVRSSERSAVAEKLTRAEHLAEIGQLAASLAHEIKNPLAGISGAIQIIRDDMPPNDARRPIISEILSQIGRLDDTVKDLLFYARPSPLRSKDFPLEDVVGRVLRLMQGEPAMQSIRVEHTPSPAGAWVTADEGQIEQLLINLLINAAHACSDHGGRIRLHTMSRGGKARLVVEDNGRGMTHDVRDRAFEPFFTTKAKGTGLGLAICRRIVESHQGTIELESQPGHGTKVMIEIPRARDGAVYE